MPGTFNSLYIHSLSWLIKEISHESLSVSFSSFWDCSPLSMNIYALALVHRMLSFLHFSISPHPPLQLLVLKMKTICSTVKHQYEQWLFSFKLIINLEWWGEWRGNYQRQGCISLQLHLITIATECIAVHFHQNCTIQNLLKPTVFFATEVNIATFIFRTYTLQKAGPGTLHKKLEVSN